MRFGEQSDEVEGEGDVLDVVVGGERHAPSHAPSTRHVRREAGALLGGAVVGGGRQREAGRGELRPVSLEAGAGGGGHAGVAAHQAQVLEGHQGRDHLQVPREEPAGVSFVNKSPTTKYVNKTK